MFSSALLASICGISLINFDQVLSAVNKRDLGNVARQTEVRRQSRR